MDLPFLSQQWSHTPLLPIAARRTPCLHPQGVSALICRDTALAALGAWWLHATVGQGGVREQEGGAQRGCPHCRVPGLFGAGQWSQIWVVGRRLENSRLEGSSSPWHSFGLAGTTWMWHGQGVGRMLQPVCAQGTAPSSVLVDPSHPT